MIARSHRRAGALCVTAACLLLATGCAVRGATVRDVAQPKAANLTPDLCAEYPADNSSFYQKLDELNSGIFGNAKAARKRIAVIDFPELNGRSSGFGRYLSEELVTRIGAERIDLVERNLLDKALTELKLNNTDLFNPKTAKRFGELTGADALLTGTYVDMGKAVRLNSRLIDTETGRILSTSGVEITTTAAMCRMLNTAGLQAAPPGDAGFKPAVAAKERGRNLVVNGNFKNRFDGWQRIVGDEGKGSSKVEIVKYINSNSGTALHIRHTGEGFIQLDQVIPVADAGLVFSASFMGRSAEGRMRGFSGTGISQIIIQYMDESEHVLGQTGFVIYVKNMFADTPLIGVPRLTADTNTTRYVEFKNGMPYRGYKIDISRELEENLIGVNPKNVKKITIGVWCSATRAGAATELWISDISLSYK
ncbi:MAG: hypothetical protein HZA14_13075 [Nitrospirae bacterium]|nr:hypothetical protein [Nitrospirota bacterium]